MAVEAKKIGIYVQKGVVFSVKICYTIARDYPFVLGVAVFSVLLYKFFPSLFGFLVSSSPVIFCTAALLGILLSYGEPNIPEVEEEEKSTHEISSLKAVGVGHDHVIEKDESLAVEAHVERRTNEGADGSMLPSAVCEAEEVKNANSLSRSIAVEGDEEVIHGVSEPVEEREFLDHVVFEKKEFHDDGHATDDRKDTAGPEMESVLAAGGILEAHLDGHDDESSDSSSDCAESSSPDASMADVMPMLDELHPLLESEAPQPALISLDESETESDDDSAEPLGDADNVGEETHEDQKDGSEAVVKWTEDDEKNLIDLGTSELERNRRLENLIAKRIAHKNHLAEARKRNLIDFESNSYPQISVPLSEEMSRIPIQVPSLSTTKRNPFDPPYDSNEFAGLPPIPGSAPSVLLPRRNPFDLPCDQACKGSSVMADNSSGYGFMPIQQREMCFQRPESSTLGASFPGEIMQERPTGRLQPHSVAELATSMEMDYASFQIQSTDRHGSQTRSALKTKVISLDKEQKEEKVVFDEEILQDGGLISPSGHVFEAVQEENKSENHGSVEIKADAPNIVTNSQEAGAFKASEEVSSTREASLPTAAISMESKAAYVEPIDAETFIGSEVERNVDVLSSSSSSETIETHLETNADEVFVGQNQMEIDSLKEAHKSMQRTHVDDSQVKGPVYDSSPSAMEKSGSNAARIAEALFLDEEEVFIYTSALSNTDAKPAANEITSSSKTSWVALSELSRVDENELRSGKITEVSEHDVAQVGFSGVIQNANDSIELPVSIESDVKDASQDFYLSSSDTLAMEVSVRGEDGNPQSEEAQMLLYSNQEALAVGPPTVEVEKTDSVLFTSDGLLLADDPTPLASQPSVEETITQPSHGKSQDGSSNLDKDVHEPDENIYSKVSLLAPGLDGDDLTALHVLEQPNTESSSKSYMMSEEILEKETDAGLIDVEENILDQCRNEHLNDSEGANDKLNVDEYAGADGIKEIDEGLLSELDAVGDFSVQEPKSDAVESEKQLQSEPDSVAETLIHAGIKDGLPGLQNLQSESVEAFGIERSAGPQSPIDQPYSEAQFIQFEMSDQCPDLKEPSSELQVLEACSLADIDLAFKQAQEGEVEKSVVVESFTDQPIGLDAEAGPSNTEPEKVETDLPDNVPRLEVLEARSLEDIKSAFKQLHEGVHEKFVTDEPLLFKSESASSAAFLDTKYEVIDAKVGVGFAENEMPREGSDLFDTASHMQVWDTDAAFKQPHEVVHDKSVVEEPMVVESEIGSSVFSSEEKQLDLPKPETQDIEVGSSNVEATVQDAALIVIGSKLNVLDTSSVEDADSASKRIHEQYIEKPTFDEPQLVESEIGPFVLLVDEKHLDSSNLAVVDTEIGSSTIKLANGDADLTGTSSEMQVLEARSLEDINKAFKQLHEQGLEKGVAVESEIGQSTSTADDKLQDPSVLEVTNAEVVPAKTETVKGDSNLKEIISELQVLDARSLEDTDSAFKQFHEHDPQKSVVEDSQLVESEFSLHATSQDGEHQEHVEVPSDIQVLEDTDSAFKQFHEHDPQKSVIEEPRLVESEFSLHATPQDGEHQEHVDVPSHIQVLEDTDSAFKQFNEHDIQKSVVEEPQLVESEFSLHAAPQDDEHWEHVETPSDIQVLEARSLEDIQAALKPALESQPKLFVTEATEIQVEPIVPSQTAEENQVELEESSVVERSSITEEPSAGKPKDEVKLPESSDSNKSTSKLMTEAKEIHVEPVAASQIAEENLVELRESFVVEGSSITDESSARNLEDEVKGLESSESNKSTSKSATEVTEIHAEPFAPSQTAEEDQVELRESPVVEIASIAEEPTARKPKDEAKAPESSDSDKATSKVVAEATEIHVEPVASFQTAEESQVELRESPVVESSSITEDPSAGKTKDEVKAPESSHFNKSTSKRKSKKKSGSGTSSSSSSSSSSSDSD